MRAGLRAGAATSFQEIGMTLPVSLEDAKRQLRVIGDHENEAIEGIIRDAAGWVETYTGHLLEQREVADRFSCFSRLSLSAWPIADVPIVVSVISDGTTVVEGAWLDAIQRPARVLPALPGRWPTLATGDIIEVRYTAGYTSPDEVPRNFVRTMLLLIGAYFADREGGEVVQKAEASARRLCRSSRTWGV